MGVILPITGPDLEGPRGQISYCCIADLDGCGIRRSGDDAACRSDPTFTRASPGLAVAEQLPQIIIIVKIRRLNGEAPEISRRPKAGQ